MKFLILAPFAELGTVWGMVEGLEANGHTWERIETKPAHQARQPGFPELVINKFHQGNFDTVLIGKGSTIPLHNFRRITDKVDTTYWCPDSVSGNGCGPVARPEDVGARGLLCTRIVCTGTEGARWWRKNGYKGRIAQVYQGCRHRLWREPKFKPRAVHQYQTCFLGSANYKGDGGRREKLKAIQNAGFTLFLHKRTFHKKAAEVYRNSAVCMNFVCGTPGEGQCPIGITSNRLVRVLTSGGFCLTELNSDIKHTFEDGNQLAWFGWQNTSEMIEKLRHYMNKPKERAEIAMRAWEWTADWGWDRQMEKLVKFVRGEDIAADGAAGPYVGAYRDDKN